MSDTPETDNVARGNHVVSTGFAQDLERQLSFARAMVHKLRRERAVARQFGEQMSESNAVLLADLRHLREVAEDLLEKNAKHRAAVCPSCGRAVEIVRLKEASK